MGKISVRLQISGLQIDASRIRGLKPHFLVYNFPRAEARGWSLAFY